MSYKKAWFTLILVTIITFLPAISADFVPWDDDAHFLSNQQVKKFEFPQFYKIFLEPDNANHTYIPLSTLSWAVEYKLFGMSPMVFHLTNVALHVAAVSVVFVLAGRFGLSLWGAFAAALIFAIHPTRVENVAWVTARKDLLFGLFYLLAIGTYLTYLERRRYIKVEASGNNNLDQNISASDNKSWLVPYAATLIFGLLSILSKPQALSLPLILFLVDWMKKRRFALNMLIDKLPFLLAIEPIAWVTYAQNSREITLNFPNGFLVWFWSAAFYIQKFLWPFNISPVYAMPEPVAFNNPVYMSVLVTLAAVAFVLWRWASNRWLISAFSFYFLTCFFIWRFDWRDISVVADRFIYIGVLAACFGIGRGFEYLIEKKGKIRQLTIAAFSLTMIAYAVYSFTYCFNWRSGFALWDSVVKGSPELAFGYNNRGSIYAKDGKIEAAMKDFNKAIEVSGVSRMVKDGKNFISYKSATQYAAAYDHIGQLLVTQNNIEEALRNFNLAIYYEVEKPEYFNNRGATLVKLKRFDEALADYNAALSLKPEFYEARINRGLYFYRTGQKEEALADFQKAIEIDDTKSEAFTQAGRIYFEKNNLEEAKKMFEKVTDLEPDNAQAFYNIGMIYAKQKNKEQAQQYFSQAQVKWLKDPVKYPLPGLKPEDAGVWKERLGK